MPENTRTKTFRLKSLKADGDAGTIEAVFATLNVVDSDGDRILNGAIGNQNVIMSAYGHASWGGGLDGLPVGKGRIYERKDEAIFEGRFFLDTTNGEETYKTVKNVGELQEWSFALPEVDQAIVEEDGEVIHELKRIRVNEVSPVLMGAGVDTRTLGVKKVDTEAESLPDDKPTNPASKGDERKRFVDQLDETVETVERAISRARKVSSLSHEDGRTIGRRSLRRMKVLQDALREAGDVLDDLLKSQIKNPEEEDSLRDELHQLATGFAEKQNA